MEKLELSYIGSGNVKWWSQLEKQFVSFLKKNKHKLTLIPRNSTPRFLPKKNEKFMPTQRFIYKCSYEHYSVQQQRGKHPVLISW